MTLKPLSILLLVALALPVMAEPAAGILPAAPANEAATVGPDQGTAGSTSPGMVRWAADRTQALLSTALSSLGVRYRRGASDPAVGFDCSGFVRHVYLQAMGLMLPHNAYSMSLHGQSVGLNDLRPGDLVFFNTLKHQFSHVGIYLGDNRFIHAPSAGKTVQVDTLDDSYWSRHFTGARRLDTPPPEAGVTATNPAGSPQP